MMAGGVPLVHGYAKVVDFDPRSSPLNGSIVQIKCARGDHREVVSVTEDNEWRRSDAPTIVIPVTCLQKVPVLWTDEALSLNALWLHAAFRAPGRCDTIPGPTLRSYMNFSPQPTAEDIEAWWGQDIWKYMSFAMLRFSKMGRGHGMSVFRQQGIREWHRGLVWSSCDKKNQASPREYDVAGERYMWWPGLFVLDPDGNIVWFWCQDFARPPYSRPWETHRSRVCTLGKIKYIAPAEDTNLDEKDWEAATLLSLNEMKEAEDRARRGVKEGVKKPAKGEEGAYSYGDGNGGDENDDTDSTIVPTECSSSHPTSSASVSSSSASGSSFVVVSTASECNWPASVSERDEVDSDEEIFF